MTMTWQDQIDGIANDNLSGAADVASNTARALGTMCEEEPFDSLETLFEVLQSVARRLIASQTGMAPLVTLLNRVFFAATSAADPETALEATIDTAHTFIAETEEARREVVRKAAPLIPAGVTVLTHTHSSTVAMTILQAAQSGRSPKVICLEARPLCEGRHMAIELAEAGLEVIFAVDAGAYAKLLKCDLVLLGADSLTDEGVISKIGTAGIALSAQTLGVPVYVLADTTKIWPAGLGSPPISQHPPDEVWENAPENIHVANRYFDLAPWRVVAGAATERGLLTPEELCTISREKPIHRHLRTIIAEVRSTT